MNIRNSDKTFSFIILFFCTVIVYLIYISGQYFEHTSASQLDITSKPFYSKLQKKSYNPKNRKSQNTPLKDPKIILIVAFWRSGSSWLGKLLSQKTNSFYAFEPVNILNEDPFQDIGYDIQSVLGVSVVKQIFHCEISKKFIDFAHIWKPLYAKHYCRDMTCLSAQEITEKCLKADLRIVKTVRLNLGSIEDLLTTPTLENLKVIYLARDPRATLRSFSRLRAKFKGRLWTLGAEELCPRLRGNIQAFEPLLRRFPSRLMLLRYEDLALNPYEKMSDIWAFIHDKPRSSLPPLPSEILSFVKASQSPKNTTTNLLDVHQRSTLEWQSWRKKIHIETFESVKKMCSDVVRDFGYQSFKTIEMLRNISNPILEVKNCKTLPCV